MKILLSLIILFVPISILAKQICLAPSGCSIEMDTGLCPNCIEVKEEPPIIKEEKVVVEKKPVVKITQKKKPSQLEVSKTNKKKGVCYVKPCDWLETPSRVSQSEGRNWVGTLFKCIVSCKEDVKYWDEGGNEFDENRNLISKN